MSVGLVVASVEDESIALEMEIEQGDKILAVSGQEIKDIIDFQYLTAEEEFTLLVEKANGEVWELEIERAPEEVLGIEFEAPGSDGLILCKNNCVFCFVHQMPPGMRRTLYCKDDDYRLSVTQSSFVTLSNVSEEEFQRIVDLHLSPIYVSVHAWDSAARVRLMKTQLAADLPNQIRRMVDAGLTIHTQVVLVPGYNDGEVLAETVEKLSEFYPSIQSIAIVPVGLTKFRRSLTPLRIFTQEEARGIITQGEKWQEELNERHGRRLVYFSDEFYALSGWDFPNPEVYDDFPQLDNGVGMASKFRMEMESVWHLLPAEIPERRIHMVTGISAKPYFLKWREKLMERVKGLDLAVHAIRNDFFGHTVTVAGLTTSQDIAKQVGDLNGEEFLIPRMMLKADRYLFLDDHDVPWLEEQVNGKATIVENDGVAFLESVIGKFLEVEIFE